MAYCVTELGKFPGGFIAIEIFRVEFQDGFVNSLTCISNTESMKGSEPRPVIVFYKCIPAGGAYRVVKDLLIIGCCIINFPAQPIVEPDLISMLQASVGIWLVILKLDLP